MKNRSTSNAGAPPWEGKRKYKKGREARTKLGGASRAKGRAEMKALELLTDKGRNQSEKASSSTSMESRSASPA